MFEYPTRLAEQRDGKAEFLVLRLAFYIGDAALALVFAEGHNIQPRQVRKRKGISQESKYELRRECRE